MAEHISIREAAGTWTVRADGAVIGESRGALELAEGTLPPVIYFPRGDIAMAFLESSPTTTHCPHKGDARYFHIEAGSGTIRDAAWSYEAPGAKVAQIAGHLAFDPDLATVERV